MNYSSRYLSDSTRSPYPRRRKSLVPRSPKLSRSLPAITLLSPDPYHLQPRMTPRPLSPGAFRMLPPRTARHKLSSFVILNETIDTPVNSRPPSPSGRVSPFRGHGFKSPTSSRSQSRAASPHQSPARRKLTTAPTDKIHFKYKDIGLPPKSPKRVIKSGQLKPILKKPEVPPKPTIINVKKVPPLKAKLASNKKSVVMSTVDKNNDKKPPVALKKKPKSTATPESKELALKKEEIAADEPIIVSEVVHEKPAALPEINAEKKTENLIPCYQPEKCCSKIPPTSASPRPDSAITPVASESVPTKSTDTSTTTLKSATVVSSTLEGISQPSSESAPLADQNTAITVHSPGGGEIESAVVTITTVDEILRNRSTLSLRSSGQAMDSPTLSEKTRSSLITIRAASNGSLRPGENLDEGSGLSSAVTSTTKLIRADPDVEVLSANHLLQSSPSPTMRQPLWEGERIPNGDSSSSAIIPKGRCRRFFTRIWQIITSIFCCCTRLCPVKKLNCKSSCRDISCKDCCKKKDPPQPAENRCAKCKQCCVCNPCSFIKSCFTKLNCCCKRPCCKKPCCTSSGCKKIKCCEGSKCCRKNTTKPCCAKPNLSCKMCCSKMKDCCTSCREKCNDFCRAFFCLNLGCCQKCLMKCSCCHKLKCCQKGGCCSCCNPRVKREQKAKLDKKNSRASNASKQERDKLDAALVDHSSMMKAAIPVLPSCLAWFCLLLNLGIPGLGTVLGGLFCLCFGKPRFSVNDNAQNRIKSFFINIVIGVAQCFTIIFCLVGWGWSIWWGVIMVKLARKQKKLKLVDKTAEAGPAALNHVDLERQ